MRTPVFLHIQESFYRHGYPQEHQILTQGVWIQDENLIRLEYQLLDPEQHPTPLNASVMLAEGVWHVTRPSFGADLLTLCPGKVCTNVYSGEDGYLMDVIPTQLVWEKKENGGEVLVRCRCSRDGRPYRDYELNVHYTTLS